MTAAEVLARRRSGKDKRASEFLVRSFAMTVVEAVENLRLCTEELEAANVFVACG